ncbi:PIG-L deacetylase family protein [Roseicella aquatilis]|uniref:PIG-L family deacetylase n=1 Tax=Roseicella aquatilis TaxID=2527868 RepID=A0A4R4DWA0_9PROT|nr:PIG-L family deacetylase [Roseicella aquatilis]TCZ64948.1 PIG-L family deacetylase [Roseicella aquatilis]
MPHALALSPHLDDAAFSCGGTLARLAREGWEVAVCTAFTRSVPHPTGFALACQLDKGLPAELDYMALRRAEDAEACARLGARPAWLDLPEAPHRGYPDAPALFAAPRPEDGIAAPLAAALAPLLDPAPDLVLAPQAVGGHVDHVLLVRALRAVLPAGLPVLWWTDFPYAARPHSHPARPFAAAMGALPEVALRGDAAARLAACAAYASQLGFQFGGAEGLARTLAAAGPEERFRAAGRVALPEAA